MVCVCAMLSNCVWLQIIFCSCVKETTRDRSWVKKGRSLRFPKIFIKKQTWWSNDKTIIELGYRKISWFASVSHINHLPQPLASANNWSARHWQITIFCSTSFNNCYLFFTTAKCMSSRTSLEQQGQQNQNRVCPTNLTIYNVSPRQGKNDQINGLTEKGNTRISTI